jgi:hypothetical protein
MMCHAEWEFDALKQALDAFDFVDTQLAECDTEIELQLQRLQVHDADPAKGKKRGRARLTSPSCCALQRRDALNVLQLFLAETVERVN